MFPNCTFAQSGPPTQLPEEPGPPQHSKPPPTTKRLRLVTIFSPLVLSVGENLRPFERWSKGLAALLRKPTDLATSAASARGTSPSLAMASGSAVATFGAVA